MKTLEKPVEYAEEIRKSRFIAHATPVDSVEQALAWIQQESVADATHNCWAFRVGAVYRFNDDGEPGGSAGKPILAAIDGQGLDRVAVLVVRYFGGIKLGVGGLMRAYGGVAARCLQQGVYQPIVEKRRYGLLLPYALSGQGHGLLQQAGAEKVLEAHREDGTWLEIELEAGRESELEQRLRDLSRGRITLQRLED